MSEERATYDVGEPEGESIQEQVTPAGTDQQQHDTAGDSQQQSQSNAATSGAQGQQDPPRPQGPVPVGNLVRLQGPVPGGNSASEGEPGAEPPPDPAEPAAAAAGTPRPQGPVPGGNREPIGLTAEQLGRLREMLIVANPDAVAELIAGDTFDALLDSVDGARSAFARIKGQVEGDAAAAVPRGGGTRTLDPATYANLSPAAKIQVGIELATAGAAR